MNNLMQEADKRGINSEDMGNILDALGITEKTTQDDIDREGLTFEDIIDAMRTFSSSGLNALEGQSITLPEEL